MKLGKPPVVEAWIGIDAIPSEDTPAWGQQVIQQFSRKYAEDYPETEFELQQQVEILKANANRILELSEPKVVINSARLEKRGGKRWLQLRPSGMIYNVTEGGEEYPGFEVLLSEASEKIGDYVAYFKPTSFASTALCYLDRIIIPAPRNSIDRLSDYFTGVVDFPENPFGNTVGFSYETTFISPTDNEPLTLRWRLIPNAGPDILVFELLWLKVCGRLDSLDTECLRKRFSRDHTYLEDCFRSVFTDQAWQLFEPRE